MIQVPSDLVIPILSPHFRFTSIKAANFILAQKNGATSFRYKRIT